jgi:hypothetical protein
MRSYELLGLLREQLGETPKSGGEEKPPAKPQKGAAVAAGAGTGGQAAAHGGGESSRRAAGEATPAHASSKPAEAPKTKAPVEPLLPTFLGASLLAGAQEPSAGGEKEFPRGRVLGAVVILAIIALLLWFALGRTKVVPADAGILTDHFTQDRCLNTSLWKENGDVIQSVSKSLTTPASVPVTPSIGFSSTNGMILGGVAGGYQLAGIETVSEMVTPFTVTAEAMAPAAGSNFALMLTDKSATQGVAIAGRFNPGDGSPEIGYLAPSPDGTAWGTHGTILPSLQPNTWYTLVISVDAGGKGTLEVRDGAKSLGSATMPVSSAIKDHPLYVVLQQNIGAAVSSAAAEKPGSRKKKGRAAAEPAAPAPPGQVCWRSIQALSGTAAVGPPATAAAATGEKLAAASDRLKNGL